MKRKPIPADIRFFIPSTKRHLASMMESVQDPGTSQRGRQEALDVPVLFPVLTSSLPRMPRRYATPGGQATRKKASFPP